MVPLESANLALAAMRVTGNNLALRDFRLKVDMAQPRVFLNPNNGTAAINQDGTLNSAGNPAKAGSYVSIWATGVGFIEGVDGQMATAAQELCSCGILQSYRSQILPVAYAGTAPGIVTGVVQINFQVTTAPGMGGIIPNYYSLVATGKTSDQFSVYVAP